MTAKRDAIRSIYDQVDAPDWAATNLDALADVLRDLSWLPPGPVAVELVAECGSGPGRPAAISSACCDTPCARRPTGRARSPWRDAHLMRAICPACR